MLRTGESYYLTPEEMDALNTHNEAFQVTDPIEERIQTRLHWEAMQIDWVWKTATEVLIEVGVDRPTQGDATKAAQCIRKMNGGNGKRSNGRTLLLVPPLFSGHQIDTPY
jgi:putative DNA primase/helicase